MNLWIDVTDTFFTWSGTPSGIQRTLIGLAAASAKRSDCGLCLWDHSRNIWRILPSESFEFGSQQAEIRNKRAPRASTLIYLWRFFLIHARQAARGSLNAVRSKQTIDMWEKHPSFRVPLRTPANRFRQFRRNQSLALRDSASSEATLASLPPLSFTAGHHAVLFADSHWNRKGILSALKSHATRPLSVGFCHDVLPIERPDFVGGRSHLDFLSWVAEMQQLCDQIICNSSYSAARLRATFSVDAPQPPVRTIKFGNAMSSESHSKGSRKSLEELLSVHGVRHSHLSAHAARATDWYLWVGSLDVRKNVDVLLLAAEGLAQRGLLRRPIVVVGRPSMGHAYYLHKITHHPDLRNCVVHVEFADDDLLHELWQQTVLFLFTSWAEGYGLPVAEALQMRVPVIASNATSIPEVAGDLVDYFEPWNSGQLAALIERFESDPNYREDLTARAARFVPTSWNETIDDIISGLPQRAG